MSNRAADWLFYGVTAARANSKAEARSYLERAIDSDATFDQQAEAYFWLSRVSDDAKQKREYLENVLAAQPAHPEARRDLAILDGKLKPAELVDHNQPIAPVEVSAKPVAAEMHRSVCPQCGGKLTFDAAKKALRCHYCGFQKSEYESLADGSSLERDFLLTLPTTRAHRWELPTERVLSCQSCGANFTLPPAQVAGACPFCASAYVVTASAPGELIAPDGVLPFQFNYDEAVKRVRDWLRAQPFRPDDLDKRAAIVRPRPVYLPCWTFDVSGEVKWRGYVERMTHDPLLGHRVERKLVEGEQPVWFDDLLVPASHSLPAKLLQPLLAYDTHALAPYTPDLLADTTVEVYQIALANASLVAHARAFEQAKGRIAYGESSAAKDVTYNSLGIFIESYKLALLPIWLSGYRYQQKMYPLAINGQSGKIQGDVPRGGLKKLMAGIFGG